VRIGDKSTGGGVGCTGEGDDESLVEEEGLPRLSAGLSAGVAGVEDPLPRPADSGDSVSGDGAEPLGS
jgi:hypothetical protein